MEYAHIAARFGAQAHVVQRHPLPLKSFDPDLVSQLVKVGEEHAGVIFHADTSIEAIEPVKNGTFMVHMKTKDGPTTLEVDAVVHGAGRVPNLDGMDLKKAGIAYDRKGVTVDAHLQNSTNPRCYAAGDCAGSGSPQLSFSASREGLAVSDNLLNGNQTKVDYTGQASIAFTIPPIASAGLQESEVIEQGYDIEVKFAETPRWFTNRRLNEQAGAYKIILNKENDQVLGAHFLAHHCEEFINIFALAIHQKMTRQQLKSVLWAHPSSASDLSRMLG